MTRNPQINSALSIFTSAWITTGALMAWDIPRPDDARVPGGKAPTVSLPSTFPFEKEMRARGRTYLESLAKEDFAKYRKGYFSGGDPGKYVMGAAIAKLLLDPKDAMAMQYMNDERSYKEHYHFAAVNWARFYPIFHEVLKQETKQKFAEKASRYTAYLKIGGTENHKTMCYTSALVLPYYMEGKNIGNVAYDKALKRMKDDFLKPYVKGLYMAGQGEWDSNTYWLFSVNGMMNIYDFSKDEEARLLARAALDWYVAGYALKYRDGLFHGPNQRGFKEKPVESIADQVGYLWWGTNDSSEKEVNTNSRHAMHALTSSWRPNRILSNIATKKLGGLPAEQKNSKPNYWFGQGIPYEAGVMPEVVYLSKHYTMGSVQADSWWESDQMTRFQIAASSDKGAVSWTGGHASNYKYGEGNGRYTQRFQRGRSYLCIASIVAGDPVQELFFTLHDGVAGVEKSGEWYVMQAGNTFVAVRPFTDSEIGLPPISEKQKDSNEKDVARGKKPKHGQVSVLRIKGDKTGFVVETSDTDIHADKKAFIESLGKTKLDLTSMGLGVVSYTNPSGEVIGVQHRPDKSSPLVKIDGKEWSINYPVYSGPFIEQKDGILKVSDGKDSFTIDFSGDMPVYQ